MVGVTGNLGGIKAIAQAVVNKAQSSRTTLLSTAAPVSSMAPGADHISHVRTQIPYALTAAAVAGIVGFIPAG